jgi:hypothetical protein
MAGRAKDVVDMISTNEWNIQSVDVFVDEFCFLLFSIFIFAVKK